MTKEEFSTLAVGQELALYNEPYEVLFATSEAVTVRMTGTPHHAPFTTFIRRHDEDLRLWRIVAVESEDPEIDDAVHCCPDCERPNQFGELCPSCVRDREVERSESAWEEDVVFGEME